MNVSKTKIHLDTSLFIYFDDKYFRTEGVPTCALKNVLSFVKRWTELSFGKMYHAELYFTQAEKKWN